MASATLVPSPTWTADDGCYISDHRGRLTSRSTMRDSARTGHVVEERVDAVVVPAGRHALNLQEAVRVARVTARLLIVLCSRECRAADVRQQLAGFDPRIPVVIIDHDRWPDPFPSETARVGRNFSWQADTAAKRNCALLLALALGLRDVFFLDDDIREVDTRTLRVAVAKLRALAMRAAAFSFDKFPDNSAVSHAYRAIRDKPYGEQACFIGGGGLLVAVDQWMPHFPEGIYNEDWFFVLPLLLGNRAVAHLGSLPQAPYDPFDDDERAVRQEFGDLIAERLMAVDGPVDEVYWKDAIADRGQFLRNLCRAIQREKSPGADRMLRAVRAAQGELNRIDAACLMAWYEAWQTDARRWRGLVREIAEARNRSSISATADWDADPDVIGLTHLLRRFDAAGAMEVVIPARARFATTSAVRALRWVAEDRVTGAV